MSSSQGGGIEEKTVALFDAIIKSAPLLVRLWCGAIYEEADNCGEAGAQGEFSAWTTPKTVDLDELEQKFWGTWAYHKPTLSIVNDVMFLFSQEDAPLAGTFRFDICDRFIQKEPLIAAGKANFWVVKSGDVTCKESFTFTDFKGDAFIPREALALAVLKSLVETTRTWAPLTDEDAAFWDARLREIMEERASKDPDPFARNLAKKLLLEL